MNISAFVSAEQICLFHFHLLSFFLWPRKLSLCQRALKYFHDAMSIAMAVNGAIELSENLPFLAWSPG